MKNKIGKTSEGYLDHLGNKFKTVKMMCDYHGVKYNTYKSRVDKGMSLEKALLPANVRLKTMEDHLGNTYDSLKALCSAYNITLASYSSRKNAGYDLEQILTFKRSKRKIKDHLGISYATTKDMCEKYGIKPATFKGRINRGMGVREALTTPVNSKAGIETIKETINKGKPQNQINNINTEYKQTSKSEEAEKNYKKIISKIGLNYIAEKEDPDVLKVLTYEAPQTDISIIKSSKALIDTSNKEDFTIDNLGKDIELSIKLLYKDLCEMGFNNNYLNAM